MLTKEASCTSMNYKCNHPGIRAFTGDACRCLPGYCPDASFVSMTVPIFWRGWAGEVLIMRRSSAFSKSAFVGWDCLTWGTYRINVFSAGIPSPRDAAAPARCSVPQPIHSILSRHGHQTFCASNVILHYGVDDPFYSVPQCLHPSLLPAAGRLPGVVPFPEIFG